MLSGRAVIAFLPPSMLPKEGAVASRQKDHWKCAKIAHGKCVAAYYFDNSRLNWASLRGECGPHCLCADKESDGKRLAIENASNASLARAKWASKGKLQAMATNTNWDRINQTCPDHNRHAGGWIKSVTTLSTVHQPSECCFHRVQLDSKWHSTIYQLASFRATLTHSLAQANDHRAIRLKALCKL